MEFLEEILPIKTVATGITAISIITSILAIAVKIVFIIVIGAITKKLSKIMIDKLFFNKNSKLTERSAKTVAGLLESIMGYVINFVVIFTILVILGVQVSALLAVVSVFSVAIGLGAQNFFRDIVAGFLIILEDQFGVGDYVEIGAKIGTIESIGLRNTQLRGFDGALHLIPNGEIKIVTNWSKGFARAIVDLTFGINIDMDKVIGILKEEILLQKENIENLKNDPVILGITKTSISNLEIQIIADCEVGHKSEVEMKLRSILLKKLSKEGLI